MASSRFSIGETVIWFSSDEVGTPYHGLVKWIGILPGYDEYRLGVEFFDPVGNNIPSVIQVDGFSPEQDYGAFLFEEEVLTLEEYDRIHLTPLRVAKDDAFFDQDSRDIPAQPSTESSIKMCQTKGGTCIITIGSTKTGKSSIIELYTQQNVEHSNGDNSGRVKYALFSNKRNPVLPVWVDTIGWNDSGRKDDKPSLHDILHFINENNITKVQAVIWTVTPSIIKFADLQTQGDLIDDICPGKIWNNVVIIAKAGMNPEQDCKGALEVARNKQTDASISCLSYRYIKDSVFNEDLRNRLRHDEELRARMNVVTEDEAYHLLKEKLDTILEPVQVIFKNKKCMNCGVVGDERLLPKYCCVEKVMVHNGELERYHPGEIEQYHPLDKVRIHRGTADSSTHIRILDAATNILTLIPVINNVTRWLVLGSRIFAKGNNTYYYTCCGQQSGTEGCVTVWKCCEEEYNKPGCKIRYSCCFNVIESKGCERRYKCCMKDEGADGCFKKCKSCQGLCGLAKHGCYFKSHNLVTF